MEDLEEDPLDFNHAEYMQRIEGKYTYLYIILVNSQVEKWYFKFF